MTISDLLDQIVFDSDDSSTAYRNAARRWLNLARSYIADRGYWKPALDDSVTITTSAATTDGIYDMPSGYDFIYGSMLYDETNECRVEYQDMEILRSMDPDKSVNSSGPSFWTDAGSDGAGTRRIFLWPIPDSTSTITFPAYRLLTDLTSAQDSETVDPFFGTITPWSSCFQAGMRYFHDINNNESRTQIRDQLGIFEHAIARRRIKSKLTLPRLPMSIIKTHKTGLPLGRFDPAHYNNSRT